jgi:hypothetical protein
MADPIDEYFAQYPDFNYRPSHDWRQIGPFNALVKFKSWDQNRRKLEWEELKTKWTTVIEEEYFDSTLPHYQSLCEDLGIEPIPVTVNECKRQLARVYVNIVDLTQYRRDRQSGGMPQPPRLHRNRAELAEYSRAEKKYYPLENATSEMLRVLLHDLH